MPVYEFYCPDCHVIFSFFSPRVNTEKRPACPRCRRPDLERQASVFAVLRGAQENDDAQAPEMDETALMKAMDVLAREEKALEGEDPQAAARVLRELYRAGGMDVPPSVGEYLRRLESGEDPEALDAELGPALEAEDPLAPRPSRLIKSRRPPARDDTLHDL